MVQVQLGAKGERQNEKIFGEERSGKCKMGESLLSFGKGKSVRMRRTIER